jgi:nitrogen-specific signal transduction histidine kinase/CheY-like chemotaxis protein
VLHRDVGERPAAVLKINTDITEKKKVESQLLRAQRLESIGTLASGIAHDLNNVLSPVMMALEVLQMRNTDEESRFWLKMLEESVGRGAGMVKQVLSFARGTEGRRAPVNLKHLIAEVANIVKETFPKSISIRYGAQAGLWGVYADPTQFHQVLLNLVVNARDAMPQGGTLSVEAENRALDESYAGTGAEARPGRYVAVTVSDTGVGMPPEVVERIFDPFFTTKEVGQGTGLGLSTALTIVKGHGGFMNVYSAPGRGTKFTVYVPAAEYGEDAREGQERAALPGGHGELILVVDDEESIRQITMKTLEAFGYRVLTAGDGTEAVAVYAQHRDEIAAVICDMMMPYMDGRATTLALHRMNPRVKVISSSGLAEAPRAEEAADRGVRAFLPKPYTAEALLRTLSDVLGGGL